ncbi:hypothetical protein AB1N83_010694 [Pleurotus pulmonarius]
MFKNLKKQFTCFVRWFLRWFGLPELLLLSKKLFSMLSRPLRLVIPLHKISSCIGLFSSSCGIITLPQEVLEMILAELDWKDVLNVRATCKLLCTASRSRSVWRVQHQRVSDTYDTPLNVKDSGTATSAELEHDTLHWARVQHARAHKTKQPTRRLMGRCHGLKAHLIEGGRWLLTNPNCWDPCLSVYDLDTKNIQHRILIRPQDKREKRIETFLVDEGNTKPEIEVVIALVRERPHEHLARLSFWKATKSPEDTLVARHITSFNTYAHDISLVKDLRGDYFARFAWQYTKGPQWIDVYNWRRSCSLIHHKATFIVKERLCTIRMLPGQRIIGLDEHSVMIYDVPPCRSVPSKCPPAGLPIAPLHTLALPGLIPDIYSPFYINHLGTAHFYVVSTKAIVKLTIPHDGRPPTGRSYVHFSPSDSYDCTLSLHRAYFWKLSTRKVFSLHREAEEQSFKAWEVPDEYLYDWALLDDYSGRIVERTENDNVFIFDCR